MLACYRCDWNYVAGLSLVHAAIRIHVDPCSLDPRRSTWIHPHMDPCGSMQIHAATHAGIAVAVKHWCDTRRHVFSTEEMFLVRLVSYSFRRDVCTCRVSVSTGGVADCDIALYSSLALELS